MKIRDAKPDELQKSAPAKELSPRQKAALERDGKLGKMFENLKAGQVKAIEPEGDEKLGTLQAAIAKVAGGHTGVRVATKNGVIYVSLSDIPGARKARTPKAV